MVARKLDIINTRLGYDESKPYYAVGKLGLEGAYGGWQVVQYDTDTGGTRHIFPAAGGYVALREVANFLGALLEILYLGILEPRQAQEQRKRNESV